MKAAICPSCRWCKTVKDPILPERKECIWFQRAIGENVITDCKHFEEVEE